MKRNLVRARSGHRTINWLAVLLIGPVVGLVAGSSAAGTWFLLTKEFSVSIIAVAVALSTGWFIGEALRRAYYMPRE